MTTSSYVSNLSPETTPEDLWSLFAQVAQVAAVEIVARPAPRPSRGFGFVRIRTTMSSEGVISKMGITDIDGRSLRLRQVPTGTPRAGLRAALEE